MSLKYVQDINLAILESDADIIILTRDGWIYPYGFFARLIRHFTNPNIIAVSGKPIYPDINEFGNVFMAFAGIIGLIKYIAKEGCAFIRDAYYGDINNMSGVYLVDGTATFRKAEL